MIDREKVLHGLDSCGNDDGHPDRCGRTACPYRDNGVLCTHKLAHDALLLIMELLKERASVDRRRCSLRTGINMEMIDKETFMNWLENACDELKALGYE